jgi:hypothetical protein
MMPHPDADSSVLSFLARALDDHRNGWSIGTFGAIGRVRVQPG